jgi:CHAT domain-containing protein
VLHDLASFFAQEKKFELSILFYKQTINITEKLRKNIRNFDKDTQQLYAQSIIDHYRQLAILLFQQKRQIEALQVLDLLKVQELQDFLKDVKGNDFTAQGIQLFPAEQSLLKTLNTLNITPNFNLQTWIDSSNTKTQIARIQTEAKDQTQLRTYEYLQTRLQDLNKDSALFYPLILSDRVELVVLFPDAPPFFETIPIKKEKLDKTIYDYRTYTDDPTRIERTKAESVKLYDWLIKPIAAALKQAEIKTIVYAPDGLLRYIPLAGLYDDDRKRWLIEDYQVNYVTAFSPG